MTNAELANLVTDCLAVWGVEGRVVATEAGISVDGAGTSCTIARTSPEQRPARWLLQSERRAASGRAPQAVSSITGVLGGLRAALGADAPGPGLDVVDPEWDAPEWNRAP